MACLNVIPSPPQAFPPLPPPQLKGQGKLGVEKLGGGGWEKLGGGGGLGK